MTKRITSSRWEGELAGVKRKKKTFFPGRRKRKRRLRAGKGENQAHEPKEGPGDGGAK